MGFVGMDGQQWSPEGNRPWGLDAGDNTLTGNTVTMDTYLNATQEYINYCQTNGYNHESIFYNRTGR